VPAPSSLEPKHPALRLALRVGVAALVVACVVLAITQEAGHIADIHWRFQPAWLALCLAALVLFEFLHIELWRLVLRVLGGEIEPRRARAIWSTTLLARYVPTSALMAVGRVALSEREGVPKRVTLASVVYELAFTLIGALALCVYLVWRLPALDDHQVARWAATIALVGAVVALHPAIFHRVADYAFKRMRRAPLPLSIPFGRVVELSVAYVVSFVVAGVAVLAMAQALHGLDAADTYTAIASYGLGYVAGVIAFVIPGSLGAREAGVALGLSAALPWTVAVAVAIAVRLLQMGVELAYAAVTPVIARRAPAVPGRTSPGRSRRPGSRRTTRTP
jgi:glycosyltransferase 2 family protein